MHIFFFLNHVHFIQPPEVKKKKKNLLNLGWVFFLCFDLPGSGTPMCVTRSAQPKASSPASWWWVPTTASTALCTVVPWPPGLCLKATISLLGLGFPGLLPGCRRVRSSSSRGWGRRRGLHSGCTLGSSVSGFPVGYQHLAQQFPSPCWGTVSFGKAK